jgi:hypothetical protein
MLKVAQPQVPLSKKLEIPKNVFLCALTQQIWGVEEQKRVVVMYGYGNRHGSGSLM